MKKQTFLIGAVAVAIATISVLAPRETVVPQLPDVSTAATTTGTTVGVLTIQSSPLPPPTTVSVASNASIKVGDATYPITVTRDQTVLGVMRTLASTTDFRFSGRDYSSLGFFVESINGKKQADGYVWIFYMNNKKSSIGISSAMLDVGDVVEWKYERGY